MAFAADQIEAAGSRGVGDALRSCPARIRMRVGTTSARDAITGHFILGRRGP
jgi:hypothetical protein